MVEEPAVEEEGSNLALYIGLGIAVVIMILMKYAQR